MSKLSKQAEQFLTKALGFEGFEELRKFELYKLQTGTVLDHEEIRTALQIVPRTILSLLQKELSPMSMGEGKDISLPVSPEAKLHATKMSNDVYTGEINRGGKVIAKFINRSLPGVGLVVMSTFELYDVNSLATMPKPEASTDISKIQSIIDQQLGLRDLVRQVVDQRISEREAIDQLIRMKLTQAIDEAKNKKQEEEKEKAQAPIIVIPEAKPDLVPEDKMDKMNKKNKPLRDFLDKKKAKKQPEFKIEMSKGENVKCPDCNKSIFCDGIYSGCICFGDDRKNKIYIKKNEDGFTMRFPKSWDIENIEMLLETLRSKNRGVK